MTIRCILQIDASSLISASVMAAPCALAISKLSYPETEESPSKSEKNIKVSSGCVYLSLHFFPSLSWFLYFCELKDFFFFFRKLPRDEKNILEAASNGASTSVGLVANIAANLIAFLAILGFINKALSWLGGMVGYPSITFQVCLSKRLILSDLFILHKCNITRGYPKMSRRSKVMSRCIYKKYMNNISWI